MHPTCPLPDPGVPPGGFAIIALEALDHGLVAVEGVDGYGRIVSAVLPFAHTMPEGIQAALLSTWQRWAAASFDRCAALYSWEQEGAGDDAMDDADSGLLSA